MMRPFRLKIVTPDGTHFDGQAENLIVRTRTGDLGILGGHINLVAALDGGRCTVVTGGKSRHAACIGGMVSVLNGSVTLIPTTFEWAEDIDAERAEQSFDRAQQILNSKESDENDIILAEARRKRAILRRSIASMK